MRHPVTNYKTTGVKCDMLYFGTFIIAKFGITMPSPNTRSQHSFVALYKMSWDTFMQEAISQIVIDFVHSCIYRASDNNIITSHFIS